MFDFPVEEHIYLRTKDDVDLKLYIFNPPNKNEANPAILFFHGAGFSTNKVKPNQFQHQAAHFSSLGQVSICVEYRPGDVEGLFSPIESIKHAKSAIRWVRTHSSRLGIDPDKVVVAGASAGGYLSLCCAMIGRINSQTDDTTISCIPNAVVKKFVNAMEIVGNEYKLVSFEGMGHGFFNYGNHENKPFRTTLEEMEDFLRKYDLLR